VLGSILDVLEADKTNRISDPKIMPMMIAMRVIVSDHTAVDVDIGEM